MTPTKPNYKEFTDPHMAGMYDVYNQHYPLEKEFFFDLAKEVNARKIIDIGCGTGLLTIPLAKSGYDMVGIEPAPAMLAIAQANSKDVSIKWIEGDALDLSESDCDLAIMTAHVAQFLLEDEYFVGCLRSINTSLKIGGYLAFDTRNTGVTLDELGWPTKDKPRTNNNLTDVNMAWWAEILETKGNRILYEIHTQINEKEMVSVNELIFRSKQEVTDALMEAGFVVETIYGDWDKSELNEDSPEMVFVAKKVK